LTEIGRQLGIEEIVGTPLTLRAGRYTGACELPVCQGLGKVSRLKEHLANDSIAWSESYVYADGYADVPLLEQSWRCSCTTVSLLVFPASRGRVSPERLSGTVG
jgi:phosphoserine phosphatase